MNNFDEDVAKWLSLSNTGKFDEAKDFYFETLFSSVLNRFEDNYKKKSLARPMYYSPSSAILLSQSY